MTAYWMIVFAVALLVTVGFFNLIDGIAAIANSHIFIANAHYVIGDLRAGAGSPSSSGWCQLLAALGVLAGNQAARWFAVVVIALNAINHVLHPGLSVLVADDHRRGRGSPVGPVRLRQPREPSRLAAPRRGSDPRTTRQQPSAPQSDSQRKTRQWRQSQQCAGLCGVTAVRAATQVTRPGVIRQRLRCGRMLAWTRRRARRQG